MGRHKIKIGIVVPAYNEGAVIATTLRSLPRTISGHPVEVIVVDDGSHDKTAHLASAASATVVKHIINSGAGAATRTGMRYAHQTGCDIIATFDADGQHRAEDLIKVVQAVLEGQADMVIGSRLKDVEGMVWHRMIGNIGLSLLTYLIFGAWVSDSQSGLKALTKKAADSMHFYSNDYAFSSEMIWRAKQGRLRIREVPIQAIYTDYSLKKGQTNLNGFILLAQMIKQRFMGMLNG